MQFMPKFNGERIISMVPRLFKTQKSKWHHFLSHTMAVIHK